MPQFQLSETAQANRQQRGGRCLNGTCGSMASLCWACEREQLAEHRAWAQSITARPTSGENLGDWWSRVGGRFLDTWYAVASERYEQLV